MNDETKQPEQIDLTTLRMHAKGNCKHCYGRGIVGMIEHAGEAPKLCICYCVDPKRIFGGKPCGGTT